jgi:hypothetical protein
VRRRLLNVLTVLAVLPFVAVVVAWPLSYLPRDFHLGSHNGHVLLLFTEGGWTRIVEPAPREQSVGYGDIWSLAAGMSTGRGGAMGVEYLFRGDAPATGRRGIDGRFCLVAVPYPYLLLPTGAAAAGAVVAARRRTGRARAGACARCGYDLRGGHDRCPECGTAVAVAGTT